MARSCLSVGTRDSCARRCSSPSDLRKLSLRMKARRALERRRLGIAVAASAAAGAYTLASRYADRQRRPLKGCDISTVPAAISSLHANGVGVVDGVVDASLIRQLKATTVFKDMPTRSAGEDVRRAGSLSPGWRASALGRYHRREETFDESDVKVFERVEAKLWPLVKAFFEEDKEVGMKGIYRSEMQILNAVPGSKDQTWHSDNRSRGLSIIVPLVDFTPENGATQLLLGSHNKSWPRVVQQGAQVVHAPVGAVAAYDSRTYHRGLGNQTGEGRPALIFCYDREWSPPPGCGANGSLANANLAHLLNMVSTGWSAVVGS